MNLFQLFLAAFTEGTEPRLRHSSGPSAGLKSPSIRLRLPPLVVFWFVLLSLNGVGGGPQTFEWLVGPLTCSRSLKTTGSILKHQDALSENASGDVLDVDGG